MDVPENSHAGDDRFRQLVESSPDGMVIVDSDGRIRQVNHESEQLFGYSRREMLGQPVEMLLPEAARAAHVQHRATYMADPERRPMGKGLQLTGRRKDGVEFPADISLTSLESEYGTLAVAHIRDVTELRRSQRERLLAHLVRVREEERLRVAADIHDDIIQALSAAGIRLELLRPELANPVQDELLDNLQRTLRVAIGRIRTLILDLHPPTLERDGLVDVVTNYLDHLKEELGVTCHLDVNLVSEPSPPTRTVIYRLLQESLSNVRKHSGANEVRVGLDNLADGFRACVQDDGVGFDPERVQAHASLGLAAMRELTEMASGRIAIRSRPGSGTAVEVWIPDSWRPPD